MNWMIIAIGVILAGAFFSLLLRKSFKILRFLAPASLIIGCLFGIVPAISSLISSMHFELYLPCQIPFGSLSLGIDSLSAVFIIPILVISALASVYGSGYLRKYEGNKNIGLHWFFFNLLVASMIMVVLARNAVLFLLAWETMALTSFFLVIFENEKQEVRHAGFIYLVATHIGTACLLVLFVLFGKIAGSLDFDKFNLVGISHIVTAIAFILAVIGFGTKAGFMPMHVWLPEAHPAAPSHVSAIMSGVMIKTGIYGLIRMLTYMGTPPEWWGWLMVFIGAVSGIFGVLFALAQHDIKKLLAYSSVENIGIIALGIGVGLLGISYENPIMIIAGFTGCFFHVINHAIFKSLLFFSAGSVLHATETREIDLMGGLLKKMPATALVFIIGAVAICGLPPLNGFVSEFLIYIGAFTGISVINGITTAGNLISMVAIVSLALIGGLAIACFTKVFGIAFLGEKRSKHVEHAHETGKLMLIPMIVLAVLCFVMGIGCPFIFDVLVSATQNILPSFLHNPDIILSQIVPTNRILLSVTVNATVLLGVALIIAFFKLKLLGKRKIFRTVTWDCGYAKPTAKMQYTSSSFVSPVIELFHPFLGTSRKLKQPQGFFPREASFSTDTPDFYREKIYQPIFSAIESILARFRFLQHGRLNLYILCIVVALLLMFVWKLR